MFLTFSGFVMPKQSWGNTNLWLGLCVWNGGPVGHRGATSLTTFRRFLLLTPLACVFEYPSRDSRYMKGSKEPWLSIEGWAETLWAPRMAGMYAMVLASECTETRISLLCGRTAKLINELCDDKAGRAAEQSKTQLELALLSTRCFANNVIAGTLLYG